MRRLTLMMALLFAPLLARAAEMRVELMPGHSVVDFRAYGMGLLPLDGEFTRFHGWLAYDPQDRQRCNVTLQVDVASLAMPGDDIRSDILGPNFLDVSRFPALSYAGACATAGLDGALTLHGVTKPFELTLDWAPESVVAVGRLRRAEWDMPAKPLLGGKTVRITVSVELPPAARRLSAQRNASASIRP